LTDTTDLLQAPGDSAGPSGQDSPAAAPRGRRRATSSGGGLASLVLPELQSLAADLGISGIGRLRKSQLIEAIQERQGSRGPVGGSPTAAPSKGGTGGAGPNGSSANGSGTTGSSANGSGTTGSGTDVSGTAVSSSSGSAATGSASPTASVGEQAAPGTSGTGTSTTDTSTTDTSTTDTSTTDTSTTDTSTTDTSTGNEDGPDGGPRERVDRGRERFLEREARRAERAAQAGDDGDGEHLARETGPTRDAGQARETPGQGGQARDGGQGERPARSDRQDRPVRQNADKAPGREDDEEGGRRGRFRERGRNRNRNGRAGGERFGGESDPVISEDDVLVPVGGILDILDNYGFVRTSGYLTGPSDVYLSMQQVRKYGLRRGDAVTGAVRQQREGDRKDKYNALVRLDSVNGLDPSEAFTRPEFTKLTPLYPQDRLRLETEPNILTTRVIDLVMPIGKGQRALIVSPPKAGKTMVMQAIANAITTNNPECHLMVVLVDERPEEVTDMQRSVKGEVIASTFDRPPQDHITVAELSIERAKRLVELGHDVVVLLDSITRLGRAYNLGAPASGRILTGGVDSAALYPPKRFLGAARNIENGGSLTIFATALVETGSAMDTVIFEEFKGTGNAELKLDRGLANKRIFPAIDVDASSTRKEEILLAPQELRIVLQLRRVLHALDSASSLELLLSKMKATRTNVEFLMQVQKNSVEQGSDQI